MTFYLRLAIYNYEFNVFVIFPSVDYWITDR